jgi:chromatin segregation and condensation protein Rec8/ScpA/Scc1 (kleisin family)
VARTITLEDRARIIRAALRDAPRLVLQDLLRDVQDRIVIAVTFLAMLELAKGREVTIEQAEPWGPISVLPRSTKGAAPAAAIEEAAADD